MSVKSFLLLELRSITVFVNMIQIIDALCSTQAYLGLKQSKCVFTSVVLYFM